MNSRSRPPSIPAQSKTREPGAPLKEAVSFPQPFPCTNHFHSKTGSVVVGELLSRRKLLQGLLGGVLATLMPGCDLRHQNFNIKDYPQLTREPERTEVPWEGPQIITLLTETIQTEFGFCPDLTPFFRLSFNGQNIQVTALIDVIKDQWAAGSILQQAGFDRGYMTVFENGITLDCDKNGRHLFIAVNSKGIQIEGDGKTENNVKNNSVVVKIYPSGGNQKANPTAVVMDVLNTKTYIDKSDSVDQTRKVISGDGSMAFWNKANGYFQFQQAGSDQWLKVNNTKSFLEFLRNCQCTEMIRQILSTENPFYDASINLNPFLGDIDSNETVREILGFFPKNDLDLWSRFLKLAFVGQTGDRSLKDEYRDPKTTLQSGWGDCDDYAVINAFWSYLHGYKPSFEHIDGVWFEGKKVGHIFAWYENEQYENEKKEKEKRIVVLDNTTPTVLEKGETVEDYIKKAWPGGKEILREEA